MLKLYDGGAYLVNGTEIDYGRSRSKGKDRPVRYPRRKPERRQWLTEF